MNEEMIEYLAQLGMSRVLVGRVRTIYEFYDALYPNQISRVFVTDRVTDEGRREYGSLWLFTDGMMCEAKQFVHEDNYDAMRYRDAISYWTLEARDYDFNEADEDSRLKLRLVMSFGQMAASFEAAEDNCDHLMSLLRELIIPNMEL